MAEQNWQILALDSEESWEMPGFSSFLGVSSRRISPFDVCLTPLPQSDIARIPVPLVKSAGLSDTFLKKDDALHVLCLPFEILLQILHDLDLATCIKFAQASSRSWQLAWPVLEEKFYQLSASWAGSRLICLGEACQPREEPLGLFTAAEHRTIGYGPLEYEKRWNNFYGMAQERFHKRQNGPRVSSSATMFRDLGIKNLNATQTAALQDLLAHTPTLNRWSSKKVRILRNLTSMEYVRSDSLESAYPGPRNFLVTLSLALLIRIAWSSSHEGVPMGVSHRGRWAGHRFEIRWEDDLDAASSTDWRDVSAEVAAELVPLADSVLAHSWGHEL